MRSEAGLEYSGEPDETRPVRHTCNNGSGPRFGRKTPGCLRCDQLLAGAPPVTQGWWSSLAARREVDAMQERARREHFAAGGPHQRGVCGPVCTFGDW